MADNKLPRPPAKAEVVGPRHESGPNKRKLLTPRGSLTPRQKLALICSVEEGRFSVSEACRRYGISRFTFYKWKKRYEEAKAKEAKILKALFPKKRTYAQPHPRRSANLFVGEVLEVVKRKPSLSSREIAEHTCLSETGVWGVLKRAGLATQKERKQFRRLHLAFRPWLAFLFAAEYLLGGALIPEIPVVYPLLAVIPKKRRPLALYIPLLFLVFWIFFRFNQALFIFQPTLWGRVGLVLSEIALLFGMFFFLYSVKYYLTLALVLVSSRGINGHPNGNGILNGGNGNGRLNGFLNGLNNHLRGGNGRGIQPEAGPPLAENSAIPSIARNKVLAKGEVLITGSSRIHSALNGLLNGRFNGLNGFRNGFGKLTTGGLNGINGFGKLTTNGGNGLNGNNMEKIKIAEKPFVSIHLPFYNEKKVAGRILEACSKLNYPAFEVLVLDDSNDGTTQIVEEWAKKDKRIRLVHRPNREGWKGGALKYALEKIDPRAEYVIVLDADFIPFPDTIEWFLRYFHFLCGGLRNVKKSKIAAVQGYQWHILNKDENWITRGVRGEYAGSYIIERSGTELLGSLKQIAGSVYMIRADVLKEFGWGTSITEDFQLTLRLYEAGYKVIYTPYIQGPAECVSTIKRLIRQRMRWAEGHTHNVRKMFSRLWYSPKMNLTEKLEFLYLSPYYLQSLFFLVGTLSWVLVETVFRVRLPFWTAVWGWSLVLTNMFSLFLMNATGLFIEESEQKDYAGLLSFLAMTYLIVPFQAYAAIKGFFEKEEGQWFRTPKSGLITIELMRGHFARLFGWLFPRRAGERVRRRLSGNQARAGTFHLRGGVAPAAAAQFLISNYSNYSKQIPNPKSQLGQLGIRSIRSISNPYLSLATANNTSAKLSAFSTSAKLSAFSRFNNFTIRPKRLRWVSKAALAILLAISVTVFSLTRGIPEVLATNPGSILYLRNEASSVLTGTPLEWRLADASDTGNDSTTTIAVNNKLTAPLWFQYKPGNNNNSTAEPAQTCAGNGTDNAGWILENQFGSGGYITNGTWTFYWNETDNRIENIGNIQVCVWRVTVSGGVIGTSNLLFGATGTADHWDGLASTGSFTSSQGQHNIGPNEYLYIEYFSSLTTINSAGAGANFTSQLIVENSSYQTRVVTPGIEIPENVVLLIAAAPFIPMMVLWMKKRKMNFATPNFYRE